MKKSILAAAIMLHSSSLSLRRRIDSSLTGKAMKVSRAPQAEHRQSDRRPDTGAATQKAMKDQPGTKGGSTDMPTAKPEDGSATTKA